jgi:hypothetical protein
LHDKEWQQKDVPCIMTTREKKGRCGHDGVGLISRYLVYFYSPAAPAKILWLSIVNAFNRQMPVLLVYRSSIPIETAALAIENAFTNLFFMLLSQMSHTSWIIRDKLG